MTYLPISYWVKILSDRAHTIPFRWTKTIELVQYIQNLFKKISTHSNNFEHAVKNEI